MEKRMPAHVANYIKEYNDNQFKNELNKIYEDIEKDIKNGKDYTLVFYNELLAKKLSRDANSYIWDLEYYGYFIEKEFGYDGKTLKNFRVYYKKPEGK